MLLSLAGRAQKGRVFGAESFPVLGYGNSSLGKRPSGMSSRVAGIMIAALCAASQMLDAQTLLNFETLSDGTAVTNQFSGVTFSDTRVLTAGFSLDDLEYPAHSGKNVITDSSGPITLVFPSGISTFSGYFTHSIPITIA